MQYINDAFIQSSLLEYFQSQNDIGSVEFRLKALGRFSVKKPYIISELRVVGEFKDRKIFTIEKNVRYADFLQIFIQRYLQFTAFINEELLLCQEFI